jgi:hypothetical protein
MNHTRKEPTITVEGVTLSQGQAMAVRVATVAYLMELDSDPLALGADDMGKRITAAYIERLREVERLMSWGNL